MIHSSKFLTYCYSHFSLYYLHFPFSGVNYIQTQYYTFLTCDDSEVDDLVRKNI